MASRVVIRRRGIGRVDTEEAFHAVKTLSKLMASQRSSVILRWDRLRLVREKKTDMEFKTLAIVASQHEEAIQAEARLKARYPNVAPEDADVIVALGGDGYMLQTLHRFMEKRTPIYGMNRGSVGFLMNTYEDDGLIERLAQAEPIDLRPLRMTVEDIHGERHEVLAINEVALLRDNALCRQDPHLRRRHPADGGNDLRRRPGFDAGRQHGLQQCRTRPDPAAGGPNSWR